MKYLVMLVLLAGISAVSMGCKAEAKVEDSDGNDKAKVKVDTR